MKREFENLAGINYNLYLAGTVERADTGEEWTYEQALNELESFLNYAISQTLEVVEGSLPEKGAGCWEMDGEYCISCQEIHPEPEHHYAWNSYREEVIKTLREGKEITL